MVSGLSLSALSTEQTPGTGKKAQAGMKRKQEQTFSRGQCQAWRLPWSENKLPVAGGQDADVGTCQRHRTESQLRWSNELETSGGCVLGERGRAVALHGQLIKAASVGRPHSSGLGFRVIRSTGGTSR
uniref:Uncharacterized protein n=1 Tax=Pipistrellus kuhlii TaxID=59472 RepID=A0A7J7VBK9_PIPKU|nr:hypothetical protein mPipKuh1_008517 [Pipistrellus kuhlii]